MSAPPGWHPQPDGRERWWDGQQWTEHFRDPATAAPPAPGDTQVLGAPGDAYSTPVPAYGTQGTGYGTPGAGQWPPPQKQGMSGTAKGCLIAVVVVVVLAIVAVVVGGIFFARKVNETVDEVQSAIPSTFPTDLPSAGGEPVTITLGDGFELPSATVDGGWTLEDNGGIGRVVTGMTATPTGDGDLPLLFTMDFAGGESTVCNANFSGASDSAEVTCIPVFGDVPDGAEVTVTPTF
ncbi:DUF2510 domain-containing protein [Phycicoccus sonneratiae]|uniref:DUF2510 domain-containing protein n=1 Tax=Phycicoccus sonneratiae TaxID=2807628 RepID=A0ABS2CPD6_9MICO|nr:DUF2510 domain-containing protein [Phycicoccus sonneraticus]MBM6401747.1 DUF2510 domain-containing protein [Phycicoccus sonneraticus]